MRRLVESRFLFFLRRRFLFLPLSLFLVVGFSVEYPFISVLLSALWWAVLWPGASWCPMTMKGRCYLKVGLEGQALRRSRQDAGLVMDSAKLRVPMGRMLGLVSGLRRRGLLVREGLVALPCSPHTVEDDGQFAGHRDEGSLFAAFAPARSQLQAPAVQG